MTDQGLKCRRDCGDIWPAAVSRKRGKSYDDQVLLFVVLNLIGWREIDLFSDWLETDTGADLYSDWLETVTLGIFPTTCHAIFGAVALQVARDIA